MSRLTTRRTNVPTLAKEKTGPGRGKNSKNTWRVDVPSGNLDEAQALLPDFVDYDPSHGDGLALDPVHAASEIVLTPTRPLTRFDDRDVVWAIKFIESSSIHFYLDEQIVQAKGKAGRPSRVSVLALLVAMWLNVQEGRGLLITNFRDTLFHRISPTMQTRLALLDTHVPADHARAAQWNSAAEASARRTLHRMLKRIDPSRNPKNRNLTQEEFDAAVKAKNMSDTDVREAQARLDWVCNQLLESAFRTLPRSVRRQYRGSACIDGTPLPLFSRGADGYGDTPKTSSDPDGGYYRRGGDHSDPAENSTSDRDAKYKRRGKKLFWAMDINLLVAVDDRPGARQHLPALPLAMTVEAPGKHPYDCARRLFASVRQRCYKPGYLACDALYTHSKPENFQIPARQYGYDLVLPYTSADRGRQGPHASKTPNGMVMVEGAFRCPAIPDNLVNATKDYVSRKIDEDKRQTAIAERAKFRMRTKDRPDADGNGERLTCPAAGAAPTAKCPLKPTSMEPRPTRQDDGRVIDVRIMIKPPDWMASKQPPKVCAQESVSVEITDGAKYRQPLEYGSTEHAAIYNLLRQSQEGFHGYAKDTAHESLAAPGKRRVRGKAAQTFFAAFLLASASIRKIRGFLEKMKTDPSTGDIYVDRKIRTGAHATTNNPPGTIPVDGTSKYYEEIETGDEPPDVE